MLDCVGPMGVERLKPEHRSHIPGVIDYCRKVLDRRVPVDFEFRLDDSALYCLELTEKAFRSQGLALSEPVRIGDWEHLTSYPVTALTMPLATRPVVGRPITLDQPVYVPGNDRQGVWASPLLETVFGPEPKGTHESAPGQPSGFSLRGDVEVAVFAAGELRRSYKELPVRFICDLAQNPAFFEAGGPDLSPGGRTPDGRVRLHGGGLRDAPERARAAPPCPQQFGCRWASPFTPRPSAEPAGE
jgi:hypothetical protein